MATYISNKTTIGYDTTEAGTYTTVAQIASFSGPSFKVASIETTNLSSAAKEYRPGIPDSGEMQFSLQFDPALDGHTAVKAMVENGTVGSWQVSFPTLPKATLFTFTGFPTAFDVKGDGPEGLITADCTIQITGAVAVSAAP